MLEVHTGRLQRNESEANQVQNWRVRARDLEGLSASVGLTVGGAAATAAGAAVAVAQGLVKGQPTPAEVCHRR